MIARGLHGPQGGMAPSGAWWGLGLLLALLAGQLGAGLGQEPPGPNAVMPPPPEDYLGTGINTQYIVAGATGTAVLFFCGATIYYKWKRKKQIAELKRKQEAGEYVGPMPGGVPMVPGAQLGHSVSSVSAHSSSFNRQGSTLSNPSMYSQNYWGNAPSQADSRRGSMVGDNQSMASSSMTTNLRIQSIPFEQIKIGKAIGSGAFKSVHLARWNAVEVAVTKVSETMMDREVAVMAKLSKHPNLVQMFGISVDAHDRAAPDAPEQMVQYLVMELMPHGSLDIVLQKSVADDTRMTDTERIACAEQICAGMAAIASENVIHADLACRNVLVQSLKPLLVKISDFGLAKQQYTSALQYYNTSNKGIPVRWSSPEVMTQGKWSEASDVWAFGVTMWEIWSDGSVPFGLGPSGSEIQKMVLSGVRLEQPIDCPDEIYDIMKSCWMEDPDDRPHFKDLMEDHFGKLKGSSAEKVNQQQSAFVGAGDGEFAQAVTKTFDWDVDLGEVEEVNVTADGQTEVEVFDRRHNSNATSKRSARQDTIEEVEEEEGEEVHPGKNRVHPAPLQTIGTL